MPPLPGKTTDTAFYLEMLTTFVRTGEVPAVAPSSTDPVLDYLLGVMADADIRAAVLLDEVAARVFVDTMIQFVSLNIEKANFRFRRATAERDDCAEAASWSYAKRDGNWEALLSRLSGDYEAYGFERGFYAEAFGGGPEAVRDEALWQSLLDDWQRHYDLREAFERRRFLADRMPAQQRLLETNLRAAPAYVREHALPAEEFMQAWGMMGGRWNSLEFERLHRVVRLQRFHPELERVARLMGRTAAPEGGRKLGSAPGVSDLLAHAAPSDILGVSLGRDLGALLPSEWAQWFDEATADIFLKKYLTSRLQTFDFQSRLSQPARSLSPRAARPGGPMVVCVDTSGSMAGRPLELALSLMMRLAEMASRKRRECYLIAFAADARPLDVLRDRTLLLRFFSSCARGDTDARSMLEALFSLLASSSRYLGADVLWISDFRIPLPPVSYLQEMERLREGGTKFYGLKIGGAENRWKGRLDEIVDGL